MSSFAGLEDGRFDAHGGAGSLDVYMIIIM
jgi:hypothetical protein